MRFLHELLDFLGCLVLPPLRISSPENNKTTKVLFVPPRWGIAEVLGTYPNLIIIVWECLISGTKAARGLKFWLQVALGPPFAP